MSTAMTTVSSNSVSKRGRPRVLDEVKRREVCALVSMGCGLADAGEYVGCAASTIRRTAVRDKNFMEQLHKAGMAAELNPLQALRAAGKTHWRAAAWMLERVNPDRYAGGKARFIKEEVLQRYIGHMTDVIQEEVKDEASLARICKRMAKVKRLALT